ncbi:MAG TPA: hypothetical protein PLW02_06710 [Verrucomicrobiota bacterium]|nr:hypothetical protein [Verrucomicrobiota bacterium]
MTLEQFKETAKSDFVIKKASYLMEFQDKYQISFLNKIFRASLKLGYIIAPSLGNHICIECLKQQKAQI